MGRFSCSLFLSSLAITMCLAGYGYASKERKPVRLIFSKKPSSYESSYHNSMERQMFSDFSSQYQSDEQFSTSGYAISCSKSCDYGLDTDVEGNPICECRDPCKGVKCFGGLTCTPERQCLFDQCTYAAVCKADEICSLPKPKHTFMCEKLSRLFYYDERRGRCRRFWGCKELTGNSFSSKKECKRSCYSKKSSNRSSRKSSSRQSSSVSSSEWSAADAISNHVPRYDNATPDLNTKSSLLSQIEEQTNHIESPHHLINHISTADHLINKDSSKDSSNVIEENHISAHSSAVDSQQTIGFNPTDGCPESNPYTPCPFDPCAGCTGGTILCYTSFCGHCKAIYIDLRTGKASDEFAAVC